MHFPVLHKISMVSTPLQSSFSKDFHNLTITSNIKTLKNNNLRRAVIISSTTVWCAETKRNSLTAKTVMLSHFS